MNVLRKFLEKFRFLGFLKKRNFFDTSFIKLKGLRGLKLGLFLGALALIISSSGVLYVYSQSVAGGSIGGSSLNKGLIAHWTLDADLYEEGTVNLFSNLGFSTMGSGGLSYSYVGVEDGWMKYSISGTGNSSTYPYSFNIRPMDILVSQRTSVSFKHKTNVSHKYHNWHTTPVMVNIAYAPGLTRTDVTVGDYRDIKIENISPASGVEVQYQAIYFFSRPIEGQVFNPSTDFIYFKDVQVERKPYATPFVSGTRTDRVVDGTPYANHGTNYGATPTTDRHGKVGGAMSFDGVSDRISINYSNPVNQISVVAWFKKSGTPAGGYHIIVGGPNVELSIPDSSGQIRTGVTTNTQGRKVFNSGSGLTDGNWHQVAMTYDGSNLRSFIDGQITATNPVAGNLVGIAAEIGRFLSNSYVANGSIDDVRIYNRALSEEEVAFLYDSYEPKIQISSINSGLVGHWTLSEEDYNSSGNKVTDKTPYSNNGTNYGANFTTDRHGKTGGAMSFDGVDDYLNLGNYDVLSLGESGSISIWARANTAYPSNSAGYVFRGLMGKVSGGGTGQQSYFIDWFGTNSIRILRFGIGDSSGLISAQVNNFDFKNEWTHILGTWNSSQVKLWVNGILVDTRSSTVRPQILINNLHVGNVFGRWSGDVNDLRIYNRVLSEDEISLLYNSYSPQTGGDSLQKGLVLDMPLTSSYTKTETAGSQIMTDKTPYGNNAQNYGATITEDGASFNGVIGKRIRTTVPLNQSSWSISSWLMKKSHTVSNYPIFWSFSLPYMACNGAGQPFRLSYSSPAQVSTSGTTIPELNKWYHVVATADASGTKLYVNGVLEGSNSSVATNAGGAFDIGRHLNSDTYRINGEVSNFKIYNRALFPEEIKSLYTQGAATLGGIPNQQ